MTNCSSSQVKTRTTELLQKRISSPSVVQALFELSRTSYNSFTRGRRLRNNFSVSLNETRTCGVDMSSAEYIHWGSVLLTSFVWPASVLTVRLRLDPRALNSSVPGSVAFAGRLLKMEKTTARERQNITLKKRRVIENVHTFPAPLPYF
jgi:hypothetical protein